MTYYSPHEVATARNAYRKIHGLSPHRRVQYSQKFFRFLEWYYKEDGNI
jgi:hypothetical protein